MVIIELRTIVIFGQKVWLGRSIQRTFAKLYVCPQSCQTLCNAMHYNPPGSSVHGIFQAKIPEWLAISSSRGSSQPRDWTCVSCSSCINRWILYHWVTWEAPLKTWHKTNLPFWRISLYNNSLSFPFVFFNFLCILFHKDWFFFLS